jgi:hypothetical protein
MEQALLHYKSSTDWKVSTTKVKKDPLALKRVAPAESSQIYEAWHVVMLFSH